MASSNLSSILAINGVNIEDWERTRNDLSTGVYDILIIKFPTVWWDTDIEENVVQAVRSASGNIDKLIFMFPSDMVQWNGITRVDSLIRHSIKSGTFKSIEIQFKKDFNHELQTALQKTIRDVLHSEDTEFPLFKLETVFSERGANIFAGTLRSPSCKIESLGVTELELGNTAYANIFKAFRPTASSSLIRMQLSNALVNSYALTLMGAALNNVSDQNRLDHLTFSNCLFDYEEQQSIYFFVNLFFEPNENNLTSLSLEGVSFFNHPSTLAFTHLLNCFSQLWKADRKCYLTSIFLSPNARFARDDPVWEAIKLFGFMRPTNIDARIDSAGFYGGFDLSVKHYLTNTKK